MVRVSYDTERRGAAAPLSDGTPPGAGRDHPMRAGSGTSGSNRTRSAATPRRAAGGAAVRAAPAMAHAALDAVGGARSAMTRAGAGTMALGARSVAGRGSRNTSP